MRNSVFEISITSSKSLRDFIYARDARPLDFDAGQLSQFALDLSRVERAEVTQYFAPSAQKLEQLGRGNDAIGSLLASLGEAQQRFIETLAETFEPQSAVAFNAELVPAFIEPALRIS